MTQTAFDPTVLSTWKDSSTSTAFVLDSKSGAWSGGLDAHSSAALPEFANHYYTHRKLVTASASSAEWPSAICYIRFRDAEHLASANSSRSLSVSAAEHYVQIEEQLSLLAAAEDPEDSVEEGAISSAVAVIEHLRSQNLAPPSLSWHGGDAVVMLWALGDTTFAITVTDGEIGYVVRRNKKLLKMKDSVRLDSFKLADLR